MATRNNKTITISSLDDFNQALEDPNPVEDLSIDELSAAELRQIDWSQLGRFVNVRELTLASVMSTLNITELPAVIADLPNLTTIEIWRTPKLDWEQAFSVLARVDKLTDLKLAMQKKLTMLPETLAELSALRRLELAELGFVELPQAIFKLPHLTALCIQFCNCAALPEELGNLSNLTSLIVTKCKLASLPDSLVQLKKLETLKLDANKLKALPEMIGELSSLKKLSLDQNKVAKLPASIARLTGLEVLSLDGNGLKKIPSEILKLSGLKQCHLGGNKLSAVPEQFALPGLEQISLYHNRELDEASLPDAIRAIAKL